MSAKGKPPAGYGKNRRRQSSGFKLWVLAVIANMIGIGVAVLVARIMRAIPAEASTETILRAAYYGVMLLVALADALLIDELIFGGAFRLTHLQGHSAATLSSGDNDQALAASFKVSTMSFPLTVIGAGIVTYMLFNFLNDGFDEYDRNVGKYVSDLRGDLPEDREARLMAMDKLSMQVRPETLRVLMLQLKREDTEMAAWAAWGLGMQRQIELRRHLVPRLVVAFERPEPALQREALIAMARLQHRAIAKEIIAELSRELDAAAADPAAKVDPRLAWALGYVQVMESMPVLSRGLYDQDETVQRVSAWALAQHREEKGGRAVVPILEARLPSASFNTRCALIHALGVLGDERSNAALMHAYDAATPQELLSVCEPLLLSVRPDRAGDEQPLFNPRETFAMKVLMSMGQMRASSPAARAQVEPWVEALIANEATTLKTREAADSLLVGIRSAG